MKESFIRKELKKRAVEYEQKRKLSVVVCTWNVNQKLPNAESSMEEMFHLDLDPDFIDSHREIDLIRNQLSRVTRFESHIIEESATYPVWNLYVFF